MKTPLPILGHTILIQEKLGSALAAMETTRSQGRSVSRGGEEQNFDHGKINALNQLPSLHVRVVDLVTGVFSWNLATLRARRKTAARGQTYNFGPLDQLLDAVSAYLSTDNNDGLESSADLGPLAANGRPPAYDTIWKPQAFDEMAFTADRGKDGDRECSSLVRGGGKAQEESR
ncbi:hypothetical protein LEL_08373 [Akanthomyces lecanii RCEF 1005]|uniref:Uncharacterized protein n=1 Tax=Akanthomyces lecanii RCEF 1005 TaxID=1081108 RepID=A0A162JWV1_CORDF|nr:hypothetical protein LEL_08373 [Akanthomyces lecanii RCEF 1005]